MSNAESYFEGVNEVTLFRFYHEQKSQIRLWDQALNEKPERCERLNSTNAGIAHAAYSEQYFDVRDRAKQEYEEFTITEKKQLLRDLLKWQSQCENGDTQDEEEHQELGQNDAGDGAKEDDEVKKDKPCVNDDEE